MAEVKHNTSVLSSLEEGDIIRIPREIYDHYAIYIGEGNVVHFGKDEKGNGVVKEEDFFKVCKNSKAEKYNYLDKYIRPFDCKTIVARAMSMIGEKDYNLFSNNCEHMATSCRYGNKYSLQVLIGIACSSDCLAVVFIILIVIFVFGEWLQILPGIWNKELGLDQLGSSPVVW
ncbi:hypothetical protein ACJMK2_035101 [Sinanodonta woodiana]|uniref:LRAT domain-containing protein n=1 Tax=Sinanodonta woodiana TaxID=1069815 RepID=A0ABD3WTT0_SINWO